MTVTEPIGVDELQELPIIARGEGCHVFDRHGNRDVDGLLSEMEAALRPAFEAAAKRLDPR